MITDKKILNEKVYSWRVFSRLLKINGLNHNIWSIKNYAKKGLVKLGRRNNAKTGEIVVLGKEMLDAIVRIKKSIGVK